MKRKIERKRNIVATRLVDKDYDLFLELTGRQYGATLRELIQRYNNENRSKRKD